MGVSLNLNKWVYFNMRIKAFIKIGKGLSDVVTIGSSRETLLHEEEDVVDESDYSNSVISYQPRNGLFDSQMNTEAHALVFDS